MLDDNMQNLLIVEDDDTLRDRLDMAMKRRGFVVRSVASVSQARNAITETVPDYAIVDLRLQDGSGLDVVKALEMTHPRARALVLTGYGNVPTAVSAARLGAVDYIAKPATADEIIDALLAPKGEHAPAPANPMPPEQARLEHIEHVYKEAGGNVSRAARMLDMHRRTLQRILQRHGLSDGA